jgi:hypothetical protein
MTVIVLKIVQAGYEKRPGLQLHKHYNIYIKKYKNIKCHTSLYCLNLVLPHFYADYGQSLHKLNLDGIPL